MGARTAEEIIDKANSAGVKLVRFLFSDTNACVRGKSSSIATAAQRFKSGIGIVKATMAQNLLDHLQTDSGYSATGEVRLIPDLDTFRLLPYTAASASVLCDLHELDGQPWVSCPRSFLKKQIASAAEMGFHVRAAFEPEFMLGVMEGGDFKPIDRGLCFSSQSMNAADRFITRLFDCLERQDLKVEQYYAELGAGQHELSIQPAPALQAADNLVIYRETTYGVAQEFGLTATFMPKRSAEDAGNGCHLHLSLWNNGSNDEQTNLFYDARNSQQGNLSEIGLQFTAGILTHLKALTALTCSSVNSYRRLKPRSWSSAYTCWGIDNREAAVRVPSLFAGLENQTCNIELKVVDATANPYLALGAVIACGLDGVRRKLKVPPAVWCDPSELSDEEMIAGQVERLPQSLNEALTELEADLFLFQQLGAELANTFIVVKTSEVSAYLDDAAFEFSTHLLRY